MAWCFSTRASVVTVLSTHECVSGRLWVNGKIRLSITLQLGWRHMSVMASPITDDSSVCSVRWLELTTKKSSKLRITSPVVRGDHRWIPFTRRIPLSRVSNLESAFHINDAIEAIHSIVLYMIISQRTYDTNNAIILPILRQNDVMVSVWRNSNAIVASWVRWDWNSFIEWFM